MPIYGYARCSTNEEKQDLDRQKRELTAQGAETIFSEYVRGANEIKPEQERLFSLIQPGDTIIATEISRFTRSVHQLCHLEERARKCRIKLKLGVLCLDYTAKRIDPMHRAMLYMMGTFAELERGVTVDRIVSGIANSKNKGIKGGRPRKTAKDVPKSVKDLIPSFKRGEITATELARRAGLSRQVVYKYFGLLGIGPKEDRSMTSARLPKRFRELYPRYKAGNLRKAEYARLVGVGLRTIYTYIALIEGETSDV